MALGLWRPKEHKGKAPTQHGLVGQDVRGRHRFSPSSFRFGQSTILGNITKKGVIVFLTRSAPGNSGSRRFAPRRGRKIFAHMRRPQMDTWKIRKNG